MVFRSHSGWAFPSSSGSRAKLTAIRSRLVSGEHLGLAGGLFVVAEIEPPHGLPARILHPKRLGVLDDGPGRREAAGGHSKSLPRLSTSRRISREASSPDNILPICSGGIDAVILALSSRPSPKGTPGAKRLTTAVMRAWNIDGASMMTTPTGDRLASPKVSRKWGIANEKHR